MPENLPIQETNLVWLSTQMSQANLNNAELKKSGEGACTAADDATGPLLEQGKETSWTEGANEWPQ